MRLGHDCETVHRPTSLRYYSPHSGCAQRIERPIDGCDLSPAAQRLSRLNRIQTHLDWVDPTGGLPMDPKANFGEPRSSSPLERDPNADATHVWRAEFYPGPDRPPQRAKKAEGLSARPLAKRTKSATSPRIPGARVRVLAQSNRLSCGQTSVAMAVNTLTGKSLTDRDIDRGYGFALILALNTESRGSGFQWRDGGNFQAKHWKLLEQKLNAEQTPVIIGLNGPQFSPSGNGHIITLLSIDGDKVRYADPADGTIKVTTRQAIERAPAHKNGKFFFYAKKV